MGNSSFPTPSFAMQERVFYLKLSTEPQKAKDIYKVI